MKKYSLCYIAILLAIISVGCKSVASFPIEDALFENRDDRLIGKWKFTEDTNSNNYYEVIRGYNGTPGYHVFFWDRGGKNPTYEANIYFSKIGTARFINVPYWDGDGFANKGYFFLRVLAVNDAFTKMTTATVFDTTMRSLGSKEEVHAHIAKHMNDPAFYYDTVHFIK